MVSQVAARTALTGAVISGAGLARPTAPALPVAAAFDAILAPGLRRGSTVSVEGSVSLLLALLSAASADGAWCVLVDLPPISAEAAGDLGIDLERLPLIPAGTVPAGGSSWVTVIGALIDAFDIVVARVPARLSDGELRRLAARTRQRGCVLVPYLTGGQRWPLADLRLVAEAGQWDGIGEGYGRLRQREVTVTVSGRGQAVRPRSTTLLLPNACGAVEVRAPVEELAEVVDLRRVAGSGPR